MTRANPPAAIINPVRTAHSDTADAWLRYLDIAGDEPSCLYVAGLGAASTASMVNTATHPLLRDRRALLPDLIGSGWSDRPQDFGYTIDGHAEVLAELLQALELGPVDVIGHSLGGSIAIALAATHPDLVERLIVSEPNLDPGVGTLSRHIADESEVGYVRRGHRLLVAATEREGHAGDENAMDFAATLRVWAPHALHRTAVSLLSERDTSFRELLIDAPMPRAYLEGEHSDHDLAGLADSGVAIEVVPDAGHVQMYDNLDGFAAAIAAALKSPPRLRLELTPVEVDPGARA